MDSGSMEAGAVAASSASLPDTIDCRLPPDLHALLLDFGRSIAMPMPEDGNPVDILWSMLVLATERRETKRAGGRARSHTRTHRGSVEVSAVAPASTDPVQLVSAEDVEGFKKSNVEVLREVEQRKNAELRQKIYLLETQADELRMRYDIILGRLRRRENAVTSLCGSLYEDGCLIRDHLKNSSHKPSDLEEDETRFDAYVSTLDKLKVLCESDHDLPNGPEMWGDAVRRMQQEHDNAVRRVINDFEEMIAAKSREVEAATTAQEQLSSQVATLSADVAAAEARYEQKVEELTTSVTEQVSQEFLERSKEMESEITELNDRITLLDAEMSVKERLLHEMADYRGMLEQEVSLWKEQVDLARQQASVKLRKVEEQKRLVIQRIDSEAADRIQVLSRMYAQAGADVTAVKRECELLQARLKAVEQEVESERGKNRQLNTVKQELAKRVEELSSATSESHVSLKAQLEMAEQRLKKSMEEASAAGNRCAELTAIVDRLKATVSNQAVKSREQLSVANERVRELEQLCADEKQRADDAQSIIASLEEQLMIVGMDEEGGTAISTGKESQGMGSGLASFVSSGKRLSLAAAGGLMPVVRHEQEMRAVKDRADALETLALDGERRLEEAIEDKQRVVETLGRREAALSSVRQTVEELERELAERNSECATLREEFIILEGKMADSPDKDADIVKAPSSAAAAAAASPQSQVLDAFRHRVMCSHCVMANVAAAEAGVQDEPPVAGSPVASPAEAEEKAVEAAPTAPAPEPKMAPTRSRSRSRFRAVSRAAVTASRMSRSASRAATPPPRPRAEPSAPPLEIEAPVEPPPPPFEVEGDATASAVVESKFAEFAGALLKDNRCVACTRPVQLRRRPARVAVGTQTRFGEGTATGGGAEAAVGEGATTLSGDGGSTPPTRGGTATNFGDGAYNDTATSPSRGSRLAALTRRLMPMRGGPPSPAADSDTSLSGAALWSAPSGSARPVLSLRAMQLPVWDSCTLEDTLLEVAPGASEANVFVTLARTSSGEVGCSTASLGGAPLPAEGVQHAQALRLARKDTQLLDQGVRLAEQIQSEISARKKVSVQQAKQRVAFLSDLLKAARDGVDAAEQDEYESRLIAEERSDSAAVDPTELNEVRRARVVAREQRAVAMNVMRERRLRGIVEEAMGVLVELTVRELDRRGVDEARRNDKADAWGLGDIRASAQKDAAHRCSGLRKDLYDLKSTFLWKNVMVLAGLDNVCLNSNAKSMRTVARGATVDAIFELLLSENQVPLPPPSILPAFNAMTGMNLARTSQSSGAGDGSRTRDPPSSPRGGKRGKGASVRSPRQSSGADFDVAAAAGSPPSPRSTALGLALAHSVEVGTAASYSPGATSVGSGASPSAGDLRASGRAGGAGAVWFAGEGTQSVTPAAFKAPFMSEDGGARPALRTAPRGSRASIDAGAPSHGSSCEDLGARGRSLSRRFEGVKERARSASRPSSMSQPSMASLRMYTSEVMPIDTTAALDRTQPSSGLNRGGGSPIASDASLNAPRDTVGSLAASQAAIVASEVPPAVDVLSGKSDAAGSRVRAPRSPNPVNSGPASFDFESAVGANASATAMTSMDGLVVSAFVTPGLSPSTAVVDNDFDMVQAPPPSSPPGRSQVQSRAGTPQRSVDERLQQERARFKVMTGVAAYSTPGEVDPFTFGSGGAVSGEGASRSIASDTSDGVRGRGVRGVPTRIPSTETVSRMSTSEVVAAAAADAADEAAAFMSRTSAAYDQLAFRAQSVVGGARELSMEMLPDQHVNDSSDGLPGSGAVESGAAGATPLARISTQEGFSPVQHLQHDASPSERGSPQVSPRRGPSDALGTPGDSFSADPRPSSRGDEDEMIGTVGASTTRPLRPVSHYQGARVAELMASVAPVSASVTESEDPALAAAGEELVQLHSRLSRVTAVASELEWNQKLAAKDSEIMGLRMQLENVRTQLLSHAVRLVSAPGSVAASRPVSRARAFASGQVSVAEGGEGGEGGGGVDGVLSEIASQLDKQLMSRASSAGDRSDGAFEHAAANLSRSAMHTVAELQQLQQEFVRGVLTPLAGGKGDVSLSGSPDGSTGGSPFSSQRALGRADVFGGALHASSEAALSHSDSRGAGAAAARAVSAPGSVRRLHTSATTKRISALRAQVEALEADVVSVSASVPARSPTTARPATGLSFADLLTRATTPRSGYSSPRVEGTGGQQAEPVAQVDAVLASPDARELLEAAGWCPPSHVSALGASALAAREVAASTRGTLDAERVSSNAQISTLKDQVHDMTGTINHLKQSLAAVRSSQPLPTPAVLTREDVDNAVSKERLARDRIMAAELARQSAAHNVAIAQLELAWRQREGGLTQRIHELRLQLAALLAAAGRLYSHSNDPKRGRAKVVLDEALVTLRGRTPSPSHLRRHVDVENADDEPSVATKVGSSVPKKRNETPLVKAPRKGEKGGVARRTSTRASSIADVVKSETAKPSTAPSARVGGRVEGGAGVLTKPSTAINGGVTAAHRAASPNSVAKGGDTGRTSQKFVAARAPPPPGVCVGAGSGGGSGGDDDDDDGRMSVCSARSDATLAARVADALAQPMLLPDGSEVKQPLDVDMGESPEDALSHAEADAEASSLFANTRTAVLARAPFVGTGHTDEPLRIPVWGESVGGAGGGEEGGRSANAVAKGTRAKSRSRRRFVELVLPGGVVRLPPGVDVGALEAMIADQRTAVGFSGCAAAVAAALTSAINHALMFTNGGSGGSLGVGKPCGHGVGGTCEATTKGVCGADCVEGCDACPAEGDGCASLHNRRCGHAARAHLKRLQSSASPLRAVTARKPLTLSATASSPSKRCGTAAVGHPKGTVRHTDALPKVPTREGLRQAAAEAAGTERVTVEERAAAASEAAIARMSRPAPPVLTPQFVGAPGTHPPIVHSVGPPPKPLSGPAIMAMAAAEAVAAAEAEELALKRSAARTVLDEGMGPGGGVGSVSLKAPPTALRPTTKASTMGNARGGAARGTLASSHPAMGPPIQGNRPPPEAAPNRAALEAAERAHALMSSSPSKSRSALAGGGGAGGVSVLPWAELASKMAPNGPQKGVTVHEVAPSVRGAVGAKGPVTSTERAWAGALLRATKSFKE